MLAGSGVKCCRQRETMLLKAKQDAKRTSCFTPLCLGYLSFFLFSRRQITEQTDPAQHPQKLMGNREYVLERIINGGKRCESSHSLDQICLSIRKRTLRASAIEWYACVNHENLLVRFLWPEPPRFAHL